jgi:hypothetical protein
MIKNTTAAYSIPKSRQEADQWNQLNSQSRREAKTRSIIFFTFNEINYTETLKALTMASLCGLDLNQVLHEKQ